jgi:hypothetical protein
MTCRVPFSNERWPNYFVSEPRTLVTTSQPLSFTLGTGPQVLSSVLPQCLETKHEVIIVTCFWSTTSQSCRDVASLLRKLSARAIEQDRRIQVRLCFSTESAWRRFNPRRRTGKIHPPKSWERLGLPAKEEIKGLNLVVKSTFVPPFSVMHPKFILMDRERAWMPSCNVSWENWFEGCIEVRGNVTNKIFEFWSSFWGAGVAGLLPQLPMETSTTNSSMVSNQIEQPLYNAGDNYHHAPVTASLVPIIPHPPATRNSSHDVPPAHLPGREVQDIHPNAKLDMSSCS